MKTWFCAPKWLGGQFLCEESTVGEFLGHSQKSKVRFWQIHQNCYTMHTFSIYHGAHNSPPSYAKIKKVWSFISTVLTSLHGVVLRHRDNFLYFATSLCLLSPYWSHTMFCFFTKILYVFLCYVCFSSSVTESILGLKLFSNFSNM
jgi:hypothetical protein